MSAGSALVVIVAGAGAAAVAGLAVIGSAPDARSLPAPWSGEVVAAPAPDLPDDPAAERLLHRAVAAARGASYRGVAAVQEWGAEGGVARVVEVVRATGVGTSVRVRGSMEEPVQTAEPGAPGVAPGDSGRVVGLLADTFAVTLGPRDEVAGRRTRVVEARRAGGQLAARLWIDAASGLVLRREVYDAAGRTAQAAGFLSVQLDRMPERESQAPATASAAGVAAERADPSDPVTDPAESSGVRADGAPAGAGGVAGWLRPADPAVLPDWRAQGWVCPEALPDGLTLVDVRRGSQDGDGVVQLVYSDGLVTVSLFQQRGTLDPSALTGFRAAEIGGVPAWIGPGAPSQVVWQSGDSVLTLVADAPGDLVTAVVAALPGRTAVAPGLLDRVARGWERVAEAAWPG